MVVRVPWVLCVHVPICAWCISIVSLYIHMAFPATTQSYGGIWKHLTYLNLVLQAVFFALCVLVDTVSRIGSGSGVQSVLVKSRDFLLTVFVFPYAAVVFCFFWSIYAFDRELIYPKLIDAFMPTWINHAMHTVILPLALVQMYVENHVYASRLKSVTALWFSGILYASWVNWVHHASGEWVYPIFATLSPMGRSLFWGALLISQCLMYLLGEKLCGRMQSRASEEKVLKRS